MHEPRSLTIEPFDPSEVAALRKLARLDRTMTGLLRLAVRIQFLQATTGSMLGQDAERGIAILEDCVLFLLAAHPASADGDVGQKAMLFRCRPQRGDDNVAALLCAGLEADCARLGIIPSAIPSSEDPFGP